MRILDDLQRQRFPFLVPCRVS